MKPKLFLKLAALLLLPLTLFAEIDLEVAWQKNFFPVLPKYVSFSPDGQYLYVATGLKIFKYSTINGDSLSEFENNYGVSIYNMQISESGKYICAQGGNGNVCIWDVAKEKAVKYLSYVPNEGTGGAAGITISPDDKIALITVSLLPNDFGGILNRFIVVYDLEQDKEIKRIERNDLNFQHIRFSHNGQYFITTSVTYDKIQDKSISKVILWETATWSEIAVLEEYINDSPYRHLKFSRDDRYLGIVRSDNVGKIFDLSTKQLFKTSEAGLDCFNIEFLPDNEHYLMRAGTTGIYLYTYNKLIEKYNYQGDISCSGSHNGTDYIYVNYGYDIDFLKVVESTGNITKGNWNISEIKVHSEKGKVTLELYGITNPNVNVLITDLLSKIVYTEHFPVSMEHMRYDLKADLPSGIYLCRAIAGNKEFTQKFEVAR